MMNFKQTFGVVLCAALLFSAGSASAEYVYWTNAGTGDWSRSGAFHHRGTCRAYHSAAPSAGTNRPAPAGACCSASSTASGSPAASWRTDRYII